MREKRRSECALVRWWEKNGKNFVWRQTIISSRDEEEDDDESKTEVMANNVSLTEQYEAQTYIFFSLSTHKNAEISSFDAVSFAFRIDKTYQTCYSSCFRFTVFCEWSLKISRISISFVQTCQYFDMTHSWRFPRMVESFSCLGYLKCIIYVFQFHE